MELDPEVAFRDDEDGPENELLQGQESNKESAVRLVDASLKMFSTSTSTQIFASRCKRKRDATFGDLRFLEECHFKAQVSTRGHRDAMASIRSSLTDRQKEIFQTTCFGKFLQLRDSRFSGVLVHSFILCKVVRANSVKELWFRINGIDVRFSPYEFALVTGLRFNRRSKIQQYLPSLADHRIRETYFAGKTSVTYIDIMHVFERRAWGDNDSDAVKLALLYYLHIGLLGADKRNVIPKEILQLVDHVDKFNTYPWGVHVWQMTYKSICNCIGRLCVEFEPIKNKTPHMQQYSLMGFPLAFQFWIYETLNTLESWVDQISPLARPRMLRWRTRDVPGWNDGNVNFPLAASSVEKGEDWYRDIIEYMGMSDVRLMSSPSMSSLEPTKSQPPYFVPLTTEPLTKETLVIEPPTVETQTIESSTVEPPSHEAFRSYVDTTIAQWGSLILD
ncbi:uncharacterized protein LOC123202288 isoform X3 [Mangifera indica]|uniref:uncharacterized protein LOC123202288 isoform X3 n=1 Tax=Mangifera indica TaxID=29780 RepID=UPI001CFBA9AD|nr:uncharacterized protein LOC123202288 isoform X3 [Mangifera indica]